jgi:soluble lytic murein transglycosylase-like protein
MPRILESTAVIVVLVMAPWHLGSSQTLAPAAGWVRGDSSQSADAGAVPRFGAGSPGGFRKVSEKSRRIARRLDATGYYSRLSSAYKGYPHLRSKDHTKRKTWSARYSAETRKRLRPQVEEIARSHGLDPALLDAVILVESGYDPSAVSHKGAIGLMQLMPDTAARFEVSDPSDPIENMRGGARYLRWLMDYFENDLELTLAAYNAGETSLARNGDQVPPYEETRNFVDRVLRRYRMSNGR